MTGALLSAGLAMTLVTGKTTAAPRQAQGADLAGYLEKRGLDTLLAAHLERRVQETVDQVEREQLALQLGRVYARLLEGASDAATMQDLERRGRELLALVPQTSAGELRMAVLRASYRSAALVAENHRIRAADSASVSQAIQTLERIVPELLELRDSLGTLLDSLQRRLSRAAGVDAALLNDEVDEQSRLRAQVTYIAAWAQYYLAWLRGTPASAIGADPLFVSLLDTGVDQPQPKDVSVDLRGTESYARSILGLALVRGLTQRVSTADEWLNLLDSPTTYPPLRAELPAWRLAVRLDAGDLDGARQHLQAILASPDRAPTAWVRMAAARGLERAVQSGSDSAARQLADVAVAELATRGELSEVMDLARRYGTEPLGRDGFVFAYVRGVQAFERARGNYAGEGPASSLAERQPFIDAAKELESALGQADAAAFPGAAAGCRALLGWCRYYAGQPVLAAGEFEAAAAQQMPAEAAESLWMAIVCIDAARRAGGDHADDLLRLQNLYLQRFPGSERAPRLVLHRVLQSGRPSLEAVETLRSIPPGSDAYGEAQRQSVQMLYVLFRRAGDRAERAELGGRFLAAALPLLEDDEAILATGQADTAQVEGLLVRARQVLDVALTQDMARLDVATTTLDLLERLKLVDVDADPALLDEIAARRVQAALLRGQAVDAIRVAEELTTRSPDSVWSRVAERSILRDAIDRWNSAEPGTAEEGAALAALVAFGERLLESHAPTEIAVDTGLLSSLSWVARARTRIWERSRAEDDARPALERVLQYVDLRPNDSVAIRNAAVLSEALGQTDRAIDHLRRLLTIEPARTDLWFEGKWRLIQLLSISDPARAREVMNQHKAMHPEFGPPPWGDRLQELDAKLPLSPPSDGGADEGDEDLTTESGGGTDNDTGADPDRSGSDGEPVTQLRGIPFSSAASHRPALRLLASVAPASFAPSTRVRHGLPGASS